MRGRKEKKGKLTSKECDEVRSKKIERERERERSKKKKEEKGQDAGATRGLFKEHHLCRERDNAVVLWCSFDQS